MKRPLKDEAIRWFTHAKDEFEDADELRKRGRLYLAFLHFQQAAEKAMKAYLYFKIESFEVFYTHSIDELVAMASEMDEDFKAITDSKKLDQYYIPTRYPNGLPGGVPSRFFDDPEEAETAMRLAKNVVDIVGRKLDEDESGSSLPAKNG